MWQSVLDVRSVRIRSRGAVFLLNLESEKSLEN